MFVSDSLIIVVVAMVCITTLGSLGILSVATYFKDKLAIKSKTLIKGVVENEIAITTENENKSTKN